MSWPLVREAKQILFSDLQQTQDAQHNTTVEDFAGVASKRDANKEGAASTIRIPNKPLYEQILFLARNMEVLTDQQIAYVKTLPKDKVIELIDIYNQIMRNVSSAFS